MKTRLTSSQDFRNAYEKFYNRMRNYLWPIETLKVLGEIEVEIYSAFIDHEVLRKNLDKLKTRINSTMKDDKFLTKTFDALDALLTEVENSEEITPYLNIQQVSETDPELDKVLKTDKEDEKEEEDIENENNKEAIATRYSK